MADQIRKADPLAPIDLDALLSPEGPYMRSNGHEDNAQLVDQLEWWAPVYGCDTLETLLNQIRARILPYLRPPIAGIDVPGPASDDERESVATAIEEEAQWFEHGQKTAAVMRRAAALLRQPAPAALPDTRDPECVAVWPDCCDGMYDPRCCRFPKSCSCEIPSPPIPESQANSMTSDNPPLQPLSEQELRDQWNAQADQFNQWA